MIAGGKGASTIYMVRYIEAERITVIMSI